ncbi:class I SAM-dependent methyltransferase [Thiocapsa sp. UBA6158]|jgi:SAM-dependent methyltransferase|uniref:class I SAM-dependent methyltransferase n=1 Tax=Thiocapsa sp. UBA6158 TaxID=1947692 RepID=UPI0025EA354B|nr:class I SAM-dependent methyltransferase [Thiocapsa sp. UBA6158]
MRWRFGGWAITVTVFEASPTLTRLASEHRGLPVEVERFQRIDWEDSFDGIWACASLLHVPMAELPEVLEHLGRALKPEGVLYASFKYGAGERAQGGQRFTGLDEEGLAALVETAPVLAALATWATGDRWKGERWANAIIARESPSRAVRRMCGQPHESSEPAEGAN